MRRTVVQTLRVCLWSVGILLFWVPAAPAQQVFSPSSTSEVAPHALDTVLSDLAAANVVYLGETHDRPADHAAQLQIIQALHRRNPRLAIGMEMFQRPYQAAIDRYLSGEITEAALRQQTEYDRRWGFDWEHYAPILRYAQAHGIPVVALNVPTEVTQRLAEKGWNSLLPSDRQWIPPLSEIDTGNAQYRRLLEGIYRDFHINHGSSSDFENFLLAQVVWDETMADSIADYLRHRPDDQMVVLAGQGHIMYGYGIPSRVARRLGANWTQRSVLLNPEPNTQSDPAIASYVWLSSN